MRHHCRVQTFTKTKHQPRPRSTVFARGDVPQRITASITPLACSPSARALDAAHVQPTPTYQRSKHRARASRPHPLISLTLALALVPASALAAKRLIIGGSTSVLPLQEKLAAAYHKEFPKIPAPEVQGGAVRHRHRRRGDRSLRHRRLLARPDQWRDPNGLVFTKIARDGVCIITNTLEPAVEPLRRKRAGNLHGQSPRLERSPRRQDLRPDRPVRPRRRFRYPGCLPAHLPGRNAEDLPERDPGVLQRTRAEARSSADKQAIGFVSFAYTGGVNAGRLRGHRVQPPQRAVRPVRRRA